jgi:hypothetical protein
MRPRRWLRMLDAISIGIIRGLNLVARLAGSTPEQPVPIWLCFLFYLLLLIAFLLEAYLFLT